MKTRILLHGCNGRMGQVISAILEASDTCSVVAGIDLVVKQNFSYPVYAGVSDCHEEFDVIIDFSNPIALPAILAFAQKQMKPVVIATTGFSPQVKEQYLALSGIVPVFVSANMSLGINLLVQLAQKAASVLYPEFDIEIVEAHHNQKLDAPSGTALMIADEINQTLDNAMEYVYDRHDKHEKRNGREIGIHSIRGGSIVGDHTVYFAGSQEVIEITHRAQSREVLARGAVAAAKFLSSQKPGLYSMKDLIGN
jgi:4-hydroxy-tetrahydrodipicolinate reductase